MLRVTTAVLAFAASVGIALAAGADAIKERRELTKANGEASKPLVPMMKGAAPFDLPTVQKALMAYENAADKMPGLFPSDSKTGDTNALPVIWDDKNKADLDARFEKLGKDAAAALAAIRDEASFKATMTDFFRNCGGCHDKYRAKQT
jgi:cytochrome c556